MFNKELFGSVEAIVFTRLPFVTKQNNSKLQTEIVNITKQ